MYRVRAVQMTFELHMGNFSASLSSACIKCREKNHSRDKGCGGQNQYVLKSSIFLGCTKLASLLVLGIHMSESREHECVCMSKFAFRVSPP